MDRIGPRALVAAGAVLGTAAYLSLTLAHSTTTALAMGSAVVGLAAGLIPTGIVSVVIRSADTDKTAVAVAVTAVARITAVAIGAQVAFAIITGAGLTGPFPAESGYTRAFLMGAIGAGVTLLASAMLPGRAAKARRAPDPRPERVS